MKQATGNLNSTVVVLLAVGILIAFFYYTVWPLVKTNFEQNSQCSKAICDPCEADASGKKNCEFVTCYPRGEEHIEGENGNGFQCVWKG